MGTRRSSAPLFFQEALPPVHYHWGKLFSGEWEQPWVTLPLQVKKLMAALTFKYDARMIALKALVSQDSHILREIIFIMIIITIIINEKKKKKSMFFLICSLYYLILISLMNLEDLHRHTGEKRRKETWSHPPWLILKSSYWSSWVYFAFSK